MGNRYLERWIALEVLGYFGAMAACMICLEASQSNAFSRTDDLPQFCDGFGLPGEYVALILLEKLRVGLIAIEILTHTRRDP